jgi:transcriptional regulator GlxA family with amidase domain
MKNILIIIITLLLTSIQIKAQNQKEKLDSIDLALQIENLSPANQKQIIEKLYGQPKYQIKTIGILVYDGVNDLDMMAPRYVLSQVLGAQIKLISTKPGPFKTIKGLEIMPNSTIDSVNQLDILVIPGGFKSTVIETYNSKLIDWIKMIDRQSIFTTSVCTGGWILGATGLLENKRASTNWYREDEMLKKYKAISVDERYTRDGKYWTSAGVTAAMDMCLAILQDIYSSKYVQAVMLDMEYDPSPPVKGGRVDNTNWAVKSLIQKFYDLNLQPIFNSKK